VDWTELAYDKEVNDGCCEPSNKAVWFVKGRGMPLPAEQLSDQENY